MITKLYRLCLLDIGPLIHMNRKYLLQNI